MHKLITVLVSALAAVGCAHLPDVDPGGCGSDDCSPVPPVPVAPCVDDNSCAIGDYCQLPTGSETFSTCVMSSSCEADEQCPVGFYCDPARETCEIQVECLTDAQCAVGTLCEPELKVCIDVEPWVGTCSGPVTCSTAPPTCPPTQTPLIADGCYTGGCRALAACSDPPVTPVACTAIADETTCVGRSDCTALYTGIDCTAPNGAACDVASTNCTCASFVYTGCEANGAP